MSTDERIAQRLKEVIAEGEHVLNTRYAVPNRWPELVLVSSQLYAKWRSRSLTLLRGFLPETHTYIQHFVKEVDTAHLVKAQAGLGILKATLADVQGGYLTDLKTLISSEVFDDFLEMAAHLMESGYKDPAAMLTGAVLEDGLRRIATNAGVKLNKREDITTLSQKCHDAGIYNRIAFKQVDLWKELRNKANHGEFHEYAMKDVEDMHKGVTGFLATYLK